jgi:hypothetical protein
VANLARKRAKYLLRGLRDLLDTPSETSATPGRFGPTPERQLVAEHRGQGT